MSEWLPCAKLTYKAFSHTGTCLCGLNKASLTEIIHNH